MKPDRAEIKAMSNAELKDAFKAALARLEEGWQRQAEVYRELEGRGEDVSDVPSAQVLALVAAGKLLPRIAAVFLGATKLCAAIATLPTDEQANLADGGAVIPVVGDLGMIANIPAGYLSDEQIEQVFGGGRIRTPEQQRFYRSIGVPARASGTVVPMSIPKRGA
jgi:hypothetical protein